MSEDRRLSAEESKGELLVYQSKNGQIKLEVRLENETVWLTQKMMAELFQVGVNTINYNIKEIYECGELEREATIRKFRIVRMEGRRQVARQVDFYNLDMIISVGYRVKSLIATRFRIWANERLKEYIVIVVMWLDFAEDQARRRKRIFMKDWERKLDDFLRFNERQVLPHAGSVSKQSAEDHARAEYEKFSARRRQYKEAIGEAETIKQLEKAAKLLPEKRKGRKK